MRIALPSAAYSCLDSAVRYEISHTILAQKLERLQVTVEWSTFRLLPMVEEKVCTTAKRFTKTYYRDEDGQKVFTSGSLNYDARTEFETLAPVSARRLFVELAMIFSSYLPAYVLLEILSWLPFQSQLNLVSAAQAVAIFQKVKISVHKLTATQQAKRQSLVK